MNLRKGYQKLLFVLVVFILMYQIPSVLFAQDDKGCTEPYLSETIKQMEERRIFVSQMAEIKKKEIEDFESDYNWSQFGAYVGIISATFGITTLAVIGGAFVGFYGGAALHIVSAPSISSALPSYAGLSAAAKGAIVGVSGGALVGLGGTSILIRSSSKDHLDLYSADTTTFSTIDVDIPVISTKFFSSKATEKINEFIDVHNKIASSCEEQLQQIDNRWYTLGWDTYRYNQIRMSEAKTRLELYESEAQFAAAAKKEVIDICKILSDSENR